MKKGKYDEETYKLLRFFLIFSTFHARIFEIFFRGFWFVNISSFLLPKKKHFFVFSFTLCLRRKTSAIIKLCHLALFTNSSRNCLTLFPLPHTIARWSLVVRVQFHNVIAARTGDGMKHGGLSLIIIFRHRVYRWSPYWECLVSISLIY